MQDCSGIVQGRDDQQNSFAEMEGGLNQRKNEEKTIRKIASLRSKNNTFRTATIPSSE
jgi:hypothetical protein